MEEAIKKLGKSLIDFANEIFNSVKKIILDIFEGLKQWIKQEEIAKIIRRYNSYKKYIKRVKNRKLLYAKRKAKYGK